jgi:hypothetical protein
MSLTNRRSRKSAFEAQANAVRRRLLDRLDELHQRRSLLLDPAEEIRRHPAAAVVVGASVALLLGASVAVVGDQIVKRNQRKNRTAWRAWQRVLAHPELLVPPQRSIFSVVVEKSVTAAIGVCVAAAAKAYLPRLLSSSSVPVLPHDVGEGAAVVAESGLE